MTGVWPVKEIDHINGNPSDNRWVNLREGTRGEQLQNQKLGKRNTSGLMGVSPDKLRGKWCACIQVGGRRYHLGRFSASEAAHAAYLEAKARLHPFQPVPRAA